MTMTPEQIRLAIGELEGWTVKNTVPGIPPVSQWTADDTRVTGRGATATDAMDNARMPDWPNSANAIYLLECGIKDREIHEYFRHLQGILWRDRPENPSPVSPLQRCEAFLRMKGRWLPSA